MHDEIKSNGITIRRNLFQIGNRKVFLYSGEVHYFRIPPEEWEDRLTKAKALGLNTISTYVFWSFHEEIQGKFDVESASKDLDHFLHLCENKGFYIIIRPGPWIGSDLKNGGIPEWILKDHPKILKQDDKNTIIGKNNQARISYLSPTYLRIVEKYFDKLAHVLRRHLYPHGGLILLQIDDATSTEINRGLFNEDYNPVTIEFYKKFLKEKYREIESLNTYYNQNFLSFDRIEPPNSKSQENAAQSDNEFKKMGELLRNLDWMECKERIFEEYVSSICYILRKKGIFLPYVVNVPSLRSSIDIKSMYSAYKTKIPVGLNIGEEFLSDLKINNALLEATIESYKSQTPLISFVSESKIGHWEKLLPRNQIHLLTRLILGHGIKGINMYMGVGGTTPTASANLQPFSILGKSIGYTSDTLELHDKGEFYDYGAPIGMAGQKNPSYEVIHHLSNYLRANGEKLLLAKKVYDNDFAILHYHPYSRLIFNTSKFGFLTNFQHIPYNSHQEFLPLFALGIHPKWTDIQHISLEELLKHKTVVVQFSMFLDHSCMKLLKDYIQEGGILISFCEIPTHNEFMQPDETLTSLYKASIQQEEKVNKIFIGKKKFTSFQDLHSFSLPDRRKKEFNKSNILASDNAEKPKKIYAFHRSIDKGHIYHFGFIPTTDDADIHDLGALMTTYSKTTQKTIHPKEITVLRLKSEIKEEIVTVTNLTDKKLENIEITFNDVTTGNGNNVIQVSDITILPQSSTQWSINKQLTPYASVIVCTSELHSVFKRMKKDHVQYNISGYHFRGSRNRLEMKLLQKPIKVISGKKDITKRIFQPDNKLRVQFQEISDNGEKFYMLSAVYSDDLQLILHFKGNKKDEIVDFNIKKINTFLE